MVTRDQVMAFRKFLVAMASRESDRRMHRQGDSFALARPIGRRFEQVIYFLIVVGFYRRIKVRTSRSNTQSVYEGLYLASNFGKLGFGLCNRFPQLQDVAPVALRLVLRYVTINI